MFFLDSYAIIEMAKANPHYSMFRDTPVVTSHLNLLEVYYILCQQGSEDLAEDCLATLSPHAVDIPPRMIPRIARFRLERKGTTGGRFSYADAFGYVYAQESGYTFLTGAHEFEGFPGVRFVR
jgi:hypothetical protein